MDTNTIPTDAAGNACRDYPQCECTYAASCCLAYVELEPERIAPWIGVDLDGCLAEYDGWKGVLHIGPPVAKMVQRVRTMLVQGKNVKIFTARCWADDNAKRQRESLAAIRAIEIWCEEHIGRALPVTCMKDPGMVSLFDDRAIQVEPNTGDTLEDKLWRIEHKDEIAAFHRTSPRQG